LLRIWKKRKIKKKVKKRKSEAKTEQDNEEDTDLAGNVPLPVLRPKVKKGLKNKPLKSNSVHSAIRYKAKKAGGDVLRKDAKFEPYAYMPLDPKQLNKRRRFQAHKQYESALIVTSKKGRAISKRKSKK